MSTDRARGLAELMHEVAETHHTVYRISDVANRELPGNFPQASATSVSLPGRGRSIALAPQNR